MSEFLEDSGLILVCLLDMLLQPLLQHQKKFDFESSKNATIKVYHPLYPTNCELPMVRAQSVDPSCLTAICALKKLMCVFVYRVKQGQLFDNETEIFPPFPIIKATKYVTKLDLGSCDEDKVNRTLDPILDQLDDVTGFCFGVDIDKMVEIGEKLVEQTDMTEGTENIKSDTPGD